MAARQPSRPPRRKRAEEPGTSAPGLDTVIDNLPGNVYRRVRRPDGSYCFEFLSTGLFRQFGIETERLLRQPSSRFDWIHPDDRPRFISDLEVSAATLGLLDHRVRVLGGSGRVYWARGIARPSRRVDGSTVWDGLVIDVTREVEAEAALRLAKEEADRAHGLAARLVAAVAEQVEGPLGELRHVVGGAAAGAALGPAAVASLQTSLARLAAVFAGPLGPRDPQAALTPRQIEVLGLLGAGLSNKAIAQRLRITPGTAKLHVAAVLRATGARTRRQLAGEVGHGPDGAQSR